MAARRLLIVMLVLLGISSAIAIIVPEPGRDDPSPPESTTIGTTGTSGTTGSSGETGTAGETGPDEETTTAQGPTEPGVKAATVNLDGKAPESLDAKTGSRMIITVQSKDGSLVEVEGLGLTGFADPYAPAVFDVILPTEPGEFKIQAPGEKPAATIKTKS